MKRDNFNWFAWSFCLEFFFRSYRPLFYIFLFLHLGSYFFLIYVVMFLYLCFYFFLYFCFYVSISMLLFLCLLISSCLFSVLHPWVYELPFSLHPFLMTRSKSCNLWWGANFVTSIRKLHWHEESKKNLEYAHIKLTFSPSFLFPLYPLFLSSF